MKTADPLPALYQDLLMLQAYQFRNDFHPYVCPRCPIPDRDDNPLVPCIEFSSIYLRCALGCGHVQIVNRSGPQFRAVKAMMKHSDGLQERIRS